MLFTAISALTLFDHQKGHLQVTTGSTGKPGK